ncbi:MAG: hypothetical protein DDT19_02803 [Syntrophomonadaceae bacterium]|nr:hypothetical protein [Bacillota bacterium]
MLLAKDIIKSVFHKYGFSEKVQKVFESWEQLDKEITLGADLYQLCRGTIYVRVSSPMMLHKLHNNKYKIIEALNRRLGARYIREIKFELHVP